MPEALSALPPLLKPLLTPLLGTVDGNQIRQRRELAQLLLDTGGHPRRVQVLFSILSAKRKGDNALSAEEAHTIRRTMNEAYNFVADVGNALSELPFGDALCTSLFQCFTLSSSTKRTGELVELSSKGLQLVPTRNGTHIGYLPAVALGTYLGLSNIIPGSLLAFLEPFYLSIAPTATLPEIESWQGAASALEKDKRRTSKRFEQVVFQTLIAWLCINNNRLMWPSFFSTVCRFVGEAETAAEMKATSFDLCPGPIEVIPANSFPFSVGNEEARNVLPLNPCGTASTALSLATDEALQRVWNVGTPHSPSGGIGFLLSEASNYAVDSVIVLALRGGGRVIICIQNKEWASNAPSGPDRRPALLEWRWGRQHTRDAQCYMSRDAAAVVDNPFFTRMKELRHNQQGPTHYFYLLATVNPVAETVDDFNKAFQAAMGSDQKKKRKLPMPERDRTPRLAFDEGVLDLEHMREWCPTAAYAAEAGLTLANLFS
jgi:hypothetical protein